MKKITLLLFVLSILFSCSDDYNMKEDFKKHYKKNMHDSGSFELVSFEIVKEAFSFNNQHRKFIDSISLVKNFVIYVKMYGSLYKIEKKEDEYFAYTQVLVSVRGKNTYGAKTLSSHAVLYKVSNEIHSIDGDMTY